MSRIIRYLSHPQVHIDPTMVLTSWSLNEVGRARVAKLAASDGLDGTQIVISSAEQKALDTAGPLATALNCQLEVRPKMHENDRSATGFLPGDAFEAAADAFFAKPDVSFKGWETAHAAQRRIVDEVNACLRQFPTGDVLFVGHGAVGTLLYCHLTGRSINRSYDQGPGGGGCFIQFQGDRPRDAVHWRPMEALYGL